MRRNEQAEYGQAILWVVVLALLTWAIFASGCTSPSPRPPVVVNPPVVVAPPELPPVVAPPPVVVTGRRGAVRVSGSALADADGEWNALGTTLFWALWGERHDADRLERNLAWAKTAGYDAIRVLAMVGAASWEDRVIDPAWSDYWRVVDALVARARRHGLRLQVTVFADAQVMMPTTAERNAFADAWAARVQREPGAFLYVETANEYWQNGFGSPEEVRALTLRLSRQTDVPVAASSPACGTHPEGTDAEWREELSRGAIDERERVRRIECANEWREMYGDGAADLMTFHFDRDVSKSDRAWRPVRQPWEMQYGAFQTGMRAYANSEPIGPQSSVAADDDPERLVMAAVVTWLSRGAAYVLHTGAGIRGGGVFDRARGRSANLWEVPQIEATVAALARVRAILPPLANCAPKNGHWTDAPMRVSNLDAVVRAYQTVCGDRFVATAMGMRSPVTLRLASGNAELRAYKWTGEPVDPGAAFSESVIVVGRWR